MTSTIAAVNQSTANTNKQPKQTAKEVIPANVRALIEQLEQGTRKPHQLPHRMGRFHNSSFGNILEIARQKPDATRVNTNTATEYRNLPLAVRTESATHPFTSGLSITSSCS